MADEEKKIVKITDTTYEHAMHYGHGVCLKCEKLKDAVDPKAERVFCVTCKDHTVYGVEVAVSQGHVQIVPEERERKPRAFRPSKEEF